MEENLGFWQFSLEIILPRLWEGLWMTLQLTIVSGIIGICLGLLLSLLRLSKSKFLKSLVVTYVTLIRGTPLFLQILFVYFALPQLLDWRLEAFTSGVIALSLNSAGYLTEIFRAAIESIDKGQSEAARSLGMSYPQSMRFVVLPQTFRRVIPPVVNELASLAKETSLVSAISLSEMMFITQRISAQYTRPWEVYFWAALGYLIIVLALTTFANRLEIKLKRQGY